jgi:hypothetical protein
VQVKLDNGVVVIPYETIFIFNQSTPLRFALSLHVSVIIGPRFVFRVVTYGKMSMPNLINLCRHSLFIKFTQTDIT